MAMPRRLPGRRAGHHMDETERAELIAALHQSATFGEGMLDLNERLLDALDSEVNRPSVEDLRTCARGWNVGERRWQR